MIGVQAAGLRARQDYLPSGGNSLFVWRRRHKNNPLEKIGQTDRQMDGGDRERWRLRGLARVTTEESESGVKSLNP